MRFRPVISALLLAAYLPACTSYRSTSQSLPELTASPQSLSQVRVTTNAGTPVEVWSARVISDTLRGFADPPGTWQRVVSIPLSEIREVEVRKTDPVKTTLAVVGVSAAFLGVVGTMWLISNPFDDMTWSY